MQQVQRQHRNAADVVAGRGGMGSMSPKGERVQVAVVKKVVVQD
jgi:hypothetical protein